MPLLPLAVGANICFQLHQSEDRSLSARVFERELTKKMRGITNIETTDRMSKITVRLPGNPTIKSPDKARSGLNVRNRSIIRR